MPEDSIPDDVRRFILTSVPSVPHLEAMLLLRSDPRNPWDSARTAQRLYVAEKTAAQLLAELCAAGILAAVEPNTPRYCYQPSSEELRQAIERMAAAYTKHIVEVTNLIHSSTGKKAQQFADAFKLRKDT
jgi:hypothetical protein